MNNIVDIEALKKVWYSFEEIQHIIKSLEDFEKTWIEYNMDESFDLVNKKIFDKFSVWNV